MNQIQMPKYKCHKEVWALKIKSIERGAVTKISFEEPEYSSIIVSYAYDVKHNPEVGGYYVVYEDGYQSYSPAQAFESGYTRM
jgi:hypothetical protein